MKKKQKATKDQLATQVSSSLDDVEHCKFKPKISTFAKTLDLPKFLERLNSDVTARVDKKRNNKPKMDPQCTFKV